MNNKSPTITSEFEKLNSIVANKIRDIEDNQIGLSLKANAFHEYKPTDCLSLIDSIYKSKVFIQHDGGEKTGAKISEDINRLNNEFLAMKSRKIEEFLSGIFDHYATQEILEELNENNSRISTMFDSFGKIKRIFSRQCTTKSHSPSRIIWGNNTIIAGYEQAPKIKLVKNILFPEAIRNGGFFLLSNQQAMETVPYLISKLGDNAKDRLEIVDLTYSPGYPDYERALPSIGDLEALSIGELSVILGLDISSGPLWEFCPEQLKIEKSILLAVEKTNPNILNGALELRGLSDLVDFAFVLTADNPESNDLRASIADIEGFDLAKAKLMIPQGEYIYERLALLTLNFFECISDLKDLSEQDIAKINISKSIERNKIVIVIKNDFGTFRGNILENLFINEFSKAIYRTLCLGSDKRYSKISRGFKPLFINDNINYSSNEFIKKFHSKLSDVGFVTFYSVSRTHLKSPKIKLNYPHGLFNYFKNIILTRDELDSCSLLKRANGGLLNQTIGCNSISEKDKDTDTYGFFEKKWYSAVSDGSEKEYNAFKIRF
jgi:hypothetical protein